ncbi:MAG: uroporphyrinogen decarboxylase family protein [Gemmatimonadota bacterium]|nr:MAG: uroporphyrinogen decarboxylase family protein [Gemmatimonadota bacterium]
MNCLERVSNRLQGRSVDRPPNFDIMMTFAAHHAGHRLREYYLDHRVLVESNLRVAGDFDLDIVQAISDPYREAADLGLAVEFPDDGLPVSKQPLLATPEDLQRLTPIRPEEGRRMSDRIGALELFKTEVGGVIPIMGWVEGALAEAADLRGMHNLMIDLHDRPEWVEQLLEFLVEIEVGFARAQVRAGADIIGLGDAVASQISPAMYREFALPYEQRIFQAVKELGAVARLHICGDTTHLVDDMKESGADILDLDWMVDFATAAASYGDHPVLCGNFDPVAVMLQGTEQQVYDATHACLKAGGERCFSMAGCEIPDKTPVENLHAQSRALWDFGGAAGLHGSC